MNGLRLRSNPATLLAYRNLTQTQFGLNNTLQRLSSGLRINKAADDSAGSAISTRMSNQILGMKQANENSQQTNNLIQTAESGLNDISGMLSRMRELATQAATDTLNASDRASINLEFQTLKNEISRVAHATEYNEMNLLNGTDYKNEVHRANTTADDVIGISVKNAKLSNDIRKGIYTLSDRHIDVSDLADISNFSGTAITDIRYSTSSLQPAHGKIRTINSQVNPAEVDIVNGGTTVADVDYISSAKIGNYSLRSKVVVDTVGISNISSADVNHGTSPTTQPGNYTVKAKVVEKTGIGISNITSADVSHGSSLTNGTGTQPGNYTIKAKIVPKTVSISGISSASVSHGDSSNTQSGVYKLSLVTSPSYGSSGSSVAKSFLFVSDSGASGDIAQVLTNVGYSVTTVLDNFANGTTQALAGDLSQYDAVFWQASGNQYGDQHTNAAMFSNLESYVQAGGRVFVTGYDSVASPSDPKLIAFLGGGSSADTPGQPGTIIDTENSLTTGAVNIRGVIPTGGHGDTDELFLAGDTVGVAPSANRNGYQWTLRSLGSGEIAYVSNGQHEISKSHPSWTNTSPGGNGAYNAALRNFAFNAFSSIPGTVQVEAPNGATRTASYDYTTSSQTASFSDLGIQMTISDGTALAGQLSSSRTFTVNPTLEVTPPTGSAVSEEYTFGSTSVDFPGLGLTVKTSNASDMTSDLLDAGEGSNPSRTFMVNPTLEVTPPTGSAVSEEYTFGSTSVDFTTELGLDVDTSNAETMTLNLFEDPKGFTVNPTLEMTPPGGSAVDTGYDFNNAQTVDFSSLSLDVDTSDAATMTTALLHNPKTFTVHPTLSIDTPAYGFDSSSSVSTSENTIALPATQVSALTVGDPVFYAKPNGGTVVGGLTDGSIYYVHSKPSDTAIALSSTSGGSVIDLTATVSSEAGHTLTPVYEFNSSSGVSTSENTITLPMAQVSALTVGDPVVYAKPSLSGTVVGGLTEGTTYYVHSKPSSTTIALSSTFGGSVIDLTAAVSSEADHTLTRETNSTYSLADTSVDVPDLGLEVDTNNTQTMTNVLLNSPQDFFVPETRELTMTGENGVQQSLQYRVGYDTTLNFDQLGIQLDIKGSPSHSAPSADSYNPHTDSLDGKQIEIAPNRDLQVGADNDVNHQLKLGITSVTASGLEIGNESVVDIDQARAAITSLDTAIDVVNQERSYLASEQNRLAFTMSNLINQTQNIEASRSSIQDADFASDAASLAKNQILAQSATAMLAQANAISQNILSLITA